MGSHRRVFTDATLRRRFIKIHYACVCIEVCSLGSARLRRPGRGALVPGSAGPGRRGREPFGPVGSPSRTGRREVSTASAGETGTQRG